jgi:hypothetical protein
LPSPTITSLCRYTKTPPLNFPLCPPATAAFIALPHRRQLSSPATDSSYPVPKTLPSTFLAVVVAMAWGMAVADSGATAAADGGGNSGGNGIE